MGKEILTPFQKKLLDKIAAQDFIGSFYLTGGTALAAYYLNHRYSEDLDFFSEKEDIDVLALTALFETIKKEFAITAVDFEKSFNRNIFFLKTAEGAMKAEFTYFPFEPIEQGKQEGKLRIDSLLDIAVNKLFTIHQKPRARDFVDLFFIVRERPYAIAPLIAKVREKFDWSIDHLNLGAQFLRVKDLKDYPRMTKPLNEQELVNFFTKEAVGLGKEIAE